MGDGPGKGAGSAETAPQMGGFTQGAEEHGSHKGCIGSKWWASQPASASRGFQWKANSPKAGAEAEQKSQASGFSNSGMKS